MKETSGKPSNNTQTSQRGTSSAPEENGAVESRTLGGLGKNETAGNGSATETNQKASMPSPTASEASENISSTVSADSPNIRGLDSTAENSRKEEPGFAQRELEQEKSCFSFSASPNEYFPNTSVEKIRDGLNSGNDVRSAPYSSNESSGRATPKSVSLPCQFPSSSRQPHTLAENYRAGYTVEVQKAEKRELRRQQREERRQEKKRNRLE